MEENIKKPRRFLKMLGKVGEIIAQEALLKILRGVINRIGGKKKLPSILFLFVSVSLFAQYPATGNKQRLGYQTTGDGLVWRGRASDTVSLKSSTINNAYIIIDTLTNVMYNYIKTKGGWLFNNADTVIINNNFSQPVDSLFFKTSVPTNNVDTAKMRWDSDLGTVVLGMYDKVPNELGFKNFWLVKNQTGSTITKGSLVYASGTVGSSGRISVSKFIANGTIDPIYLLGITAHDLTDGEDGYVISYGKIRQVNTDTFAAGAILYPSPTTAGVWTDVEPVAPNIDLPIGFCVNSSSNNGTIAIRVASGFSLNELHDVAISSPSANASLYYSGGLWRDTTASLLVSDTASMLTNYLRSGVAASTYLPLTGGTLTGALNGTTGTFTGLNINNGTYSGSETGSFKIKGNTNINKIIEIGLNETNNYGIINVLQGGVSSYPLILNNSGGRVGINTLSPNINLTIEGKNNTKYNNSTFWNFNFVGQEIYNNSDTINSISGIAFVNGSSRNSVSGIGGWSESNNLGALSFFTGGSGKSNQVTEAQRINSNGEAIFFQPFFTKSSAVFNDDSNDADFRVESDGNANMVFVDASTDRVGIGTNTPSKTLDVIGDANISGNLTEGGNNVMTNLDTVSLSNRINGKVGLTGDDIISGTKTFNSLVNLASNLILSGSYSQTNKLLGKNSSDGVGNITVGSGLNLTSDILTATQIDTTSLSNRINGKVGLTGNETIAGTKTFSGNVILQNEIDNTQGYLKRGYLDNGTTSLTVGDSDTWIRLNNPSTITITLPSASSFTGREIHILNVGNGSCLSANTNVVDITGNLGFVIFGTGGGKWATLVSTGTYWQIMQSN